MERSKITAIVLAAGRSSRMGTTKQLLPLGESTVLQKSITNLLDCSLSNIFVVLGHDAEKIHPLLEGYPVTVLFNENFDQGMSSSIRCGLAHLEPSCGSILIALGDQPFIPGQLVNKLIEAYLRSEKGIAYPTYRGRRGHPVILSRRYEAEMRRLTGDTGCREILDAYPDDHLALEVEDEAVLLDIDSPGDYPSPRLSEGAAGSFIPDSELGLVDALGVAGGEVVSLVGGGGKTTIMFGVASELMRRGARVITTTTTKIMEPKSGRTPHLYLCGREGITPDFWEELELHNHVTLACGRLPGGKLEGVAPGVVSGLVGDSEMRLTILVEADGSAQRPLKAPDDTEPVLPAETTLLVAVLGAEAIGQPLDGRQVFRPEIYSQMTGLSMGEAITVESIAVSLAHPGGLLRDRPEGAGVVVFINKVETDELATLGVRLAERLFRTSIPGLRKVILGSARSPQSIIKILFP